MQVLARGGASAAATAAAENAAREAEARQAEASGPVQLDELGRDMNVMARREAEERAQSRTARLQQSLPLLVCLPSPHVHWISDTTSITTTLGLAYSCTVVVVENLQAIASPAELEEYCSYQSMHESQLACMKLILQASF